MPLLEVDGVRVQFGGLRALVDVSMRVEEASVVGLIGPNGAGKTTLFNVISGLQSVRSGCVRFDGRDVTGTSANRRAGMGIARSFQNLGLIMEETVGVNILAAEHLAARYRSWDVLCRPWRWWSEERRLAERAWDAARMFGVADVWDERVADLSFGRARFVELASVLVQRPRLMLLDEPTTGLDAREVAQLLGVLRREAGLGTTIVLVAHDVRFVMGLCEYVYVLSEGRVLFGGAPGDVQRNPQVIEAYLGRSA